MGNCSIYPAKKGSSVLDEKNSSIQNKNKESRSSCCLPKKESKSTCCLPKKESKSTCFPKKESKSTCFPKKESKSTCCLPKKESKSTCCLPKKSKKKNREPENSNNKNSNTCEKETKLSLLERHSSKSEIPDEKITKSKIRLEKYSSDSDCDTKSLNKITNSSSISSIVEDDKVIRTSSAESEETKNKIRKLRSSFFKDDEKSFGKDKNNFVNSKISETKPIPEMNNDTKSKINNKNTMEKDKPEKLTEKIKEKPLEHQLENYFEFKNQLFVNQIANEYIDKYMCGKGYDNTLPIGFANPSGYCYLNCVVQVIVSCKDFIKDLEAYDKWDNGETNEDTIFVRGLFDLIRALKKHKHGSVASALQTIQIYITESSFGDDVYKCFMNLLSRVSNVIKQGVKNNEQIPQTKPVTSMEKANFNFKRFERRNPGFVFNNFYGQITFQTICKNCKKICNESFQMIKSLPLPVPKTEHSATLEDCINLFLNESDVELDDPMKCDCPEPTFELKSVTKITHAPNYLFMYLNRGTYNEDGEKNETTVTCKHTIEIETTTGFKKYKLISVIDHIGNSSYGHYYCKCNYETYNWCLLNDAQVDLISRNEVITKQAIVFLFKQF